MSRVLWLLRGKAQRPFRTRPPVPPSVQGTESRCPLLTPQLTPRAQAAMDSQPPAQTPVCRSLDLPTLEPLGEATPPQEIPIFQPFRNSVRGVDSSLTPSANKWVMPGTTHCGNTCRTCPGSLQRTRSLKLSLVILDYA